MVKSTTVSLNGRYVISIDIMTEIPKTSRDINLLNQHVTQDVVNKLGSLTLSSIKSMCPAGSLALDLLQGFKFYQSATFWDFKNLMSADSIKTIGAECIQALANRARQENITTFEDTKYEHLDLVLRESDFVEFIVQESIGLTLPMFKLVFMIHDKTLLKVINNSTKIKITFGQTENSMINFNCRVFNVLPQDVGDKISLTIYGNLDANDYLSTTKKLSYKGTSLEVLNKSLNNYNLKLVTNIEKTNDSMVWKLSNKRPIEYYISLWKHAFIDEEHQICTSITTEGNFNFTDIQKKKKESLKDMTLQNKLFFKQDSIYSNFGSMAKSRYIYDSSNDGITLLSLNDTGGLQKTKVNPKLSGNRTTRYSILTPEMHKNWYISEMLNQSKLYSCVNMNAWTMSFKPWDYYNVTDVVKAQSVYSEDAGVYLVIGKLLSINNRDYNLYLQLGRETYSKSTGNFNA